MFKSLLTFFFSFRVRFFDTEALLAAFELLDSVPESNDHYKSVQDARFCIAKELIRRKIIFWA